MATDIMQLKVDGVGVYVETNAKAVKGLDTAIDEKLIDSGSGKVESVNGKTGIVTLAASDVGAMPKDTPIPNYVKATQTTDGLMSKEDKKKLDGLPNITFAKVGTV